MQIHQQHLIQQQQRAQMALARFMPGARPPGPPLQPALGMGLMPSLQPPLQPHHAGLMMPSLPLREPAPPPPVIASSVPPHASGGNLDVVNNALRVLAGDSGGQRENEIFAPRQRESRWKPEPFGDGGEPHAGPAADSGHPSGPHRPTFGDGGGPRPPPDLDLNRPRGASSGPRPSFGDRGGHSSPPEQTFEQNSNQQGLRGDKACPPVRDHLGSRPLRGEQHHDRRGRPSQYESAKSSPCSLSEDRRLRSQESQFDEMFAKWEELEENFERWKVDNRDNPDEQYKEKHIREMNVLRQRMMERRAAIKKKREQLANQPPPPPSTITLDDNRADHCPPQPPLNTLFSRTSDSAIPGLGDGRDERQAQGEPRRVPEEEVALSNSDRQRISRTLRKLSRGEHPAEEVGDERQGPPQFSWAPRQRDDRSRREEDERQRQNHVHQLGGEGGREQVPFCRREPEQRDEGHSPPPAIHWNRRPLLNENPPPQPLFTSKTAQEEGSNLFERCRQERLPPPPPPSAAWEPREVGPSEVSPWLQTNEGSYGANKRSRWEIQEDLFERVPSQSQSGWSSQGRNRGDQGIDDRQSESDLRRPRSPVRRSSPRRRSPPRKQHREDRQRSEDRGGSQEQQREPFRPRRWQASPEGRQRSQHAAQERRPVRDRLGTRPTEVQRPAANVFHLNDVERDVDAGSAWGEQKIPPCKN